MNGRAGRWGNGDKAKTSVGAVRRGDRGGEELKCCARVGRNGYLALVNSDGSGCAH